MNQVLAITGSEPPSDAVIAVAAAMGKILSAGVHHLDVSGEADPSRIVGAVHGALADPTTVMLVLAVNLVQVELLWPLLTSCSAPVVVVPDTFSAPPAAISKVLVPLDGSTESANAVVQAARLFACFGVDIVVLHVFDRNTAPRFWDQPAHVAPVFGQEFLARNLAALHAQVELRSGSPGEHILEVAESERVDLIVLAWSRRLTGGRAATVRRCVHDSPVAVLLLPVTAGVETSSGRRK